MQIAAEVINLHLPQSAIILKKNTADPFSAEFYGISWIDHFWVPLLLSFKASLSGNFCRGNRPLSNFAKTKEQSRGWEDKFAISYVQRKMQICPLNVDYVLILHNSKVAHWPCRLLNFIIWLPDWNTTFGTSLLWEPFYEVVSFGPPASSLSSVVPFSSGFIAGKNSTS